MAAVPPHLHRFLHAFVPFCEANGGVDYAELAATLGALGVNLNAEQVKQIASAEPAPGPAPRTPASWAAPTDAELSPAPAAGHAFSVHPEQAPAVRLAASGIASRTFPSIPAAIEQAAVKMPDALALRTEAPGVAPASAGKGAPHLEWTWAQYAAEMRAVGKALIAIGLQSFESVAICGFNHPIWFFINAGVLAVNGLSAGTYPTNSAEVCAFVAQDARCRVVAVDSVGNLKKYLSCKEQLPLVSRIVLWDAAGVPADIKAEYGDFVLSYDDFKLLGASVTDEAYGERAQLVDVKNCAALIYTSGTTGFPKGVMMSHDSLMMSSFLTAEWAGIAGSGLKEHVVVSYLPLSHIAAQMLDIGIPIALALSGYPTTIYVARPDSLRGTLGASLLEARPTFFFGVPRVYEKFVEGIKAKAAASAAATPKTVRQLSAFAGAVGRQLAKATNAKGDGVVPNGLEIAKAAVHDKVRLALGLDRCAVAMCGAAPIAIETLEFMAGVGVIVYEVYGMSESCGMGTMSSPIHGCILGSCGPRMNPYEMKLEHVAGRDKEGEGEICYRGRHVMLGYLRNEEKTKETIDPEGWLHSGDVGRFDERGQLYITGRIKELIIGAGGENIAPVPIETALKALMPALANVVVVGDRRKYNTILVTAKSVPDMATGTFLDQLAGEAVHVNPAVTTVSGAIADPAWHAYVEAGMKAYNAHAANNASKVQKFRMLPTDLSMPGGELTTTLKLRRSVLVEKYAALIDEMYAGDA